MVTLHCTQTLGTESNVPGVQVDLHCILRSLEAELKHWISLDVESMYPDCHIDNDVQYILPLNHCHILSC